MLFRISHARIIKTEMQLINEYPGKAGDEEDNDSRILYGCHDCTLAGLPLCDIQIHLPARPAGMARQCNDVLAKQCQSMKDI